jgi:hypothetical protein
MYGVVIASSGSCQREKQALVRGPDSFHAAPAEPGDRRADPNLEIQPDARQRRQRAGAFAIDRQMQLAFASKVIRQWLTITTSSPRR